MIHDFAYADLVYDGYKAPSFLQVSGAKDVGVEFFTLSKSYNMPGWRVGFAVGNKDLIHALSRMKSYQDYGFNLFRLQRQWRLMVPKIALLKSERCTIVA